MPEYDGRLTSEAARNDNQLADDAWNRIWPDISRMLFGGSPWVAEPFGSTADRKKGIDGYYISSSLGGQKLPIGRRVQRMKGRDPYNSFTFRTWEARKLLGGMDGTRFKLQAYLKDDFDSELISYGCARTVDICEYLQKYVHSDDALQHNTNGIKFWPCFWDEMISRGYTVKGRWR